MLQVIFYKKFFKCIEKNGSTILYLSPSFSTYCRPHTEAAAMIKIVSTLVTLISTISLLSPSFYLSRESRLFLNWSLCCGISLRWYDMAILCRIKAASHINGVKMGSLINGNRRKGGNMEKDKLNSYFKWRSRKIQNPSVTCKMEIRVFLERSEQIPLTP